MSEMGQIRIKTALLEPYTEAATGSVLYEKCS